MTVFIREALEEVPTKLRRIPSSSAVSLFLFNPSSQTVQDFYKEHNQTLQGCFVTGSLLFKPGFH